MLTLHHPRGVLAPPQVRNPDTLALKASAQATVSRRCNRVPSATSWCQRPGCQITQERSHNLAHSTRGNGGSWERVSYAYRGTDVAPAAESQGCDMNPLACFGSPVRDRSCSVQDIDSRAADSAGSSSSSSTHPAMVCPATASHRSQSWCEADLVSLAVPPHSLSLSFSWYQINGKAASGPDLSVTHHSGLVLPNPLCYRQRWVCSYILPAQKLPSAP